MGASVDNIHKDFRGGKDSRDNRADANNLQRKHAVSKRQLREIARKLKVNRRMHPDDATSLYYIVKKLQDEKFDPVLLYKPQGEDFVVKPPNMSSDEIDELPITNDTFILGIQTKEQLNMFQRNALKIVCLDSTHSTNKYEFKLITLVVPDEYSKGYPVAHLISNREDELTLYYFFEAIKGHCDNVLKINAVMTDDDNTGWAAFRAVFGEDVHHLLCKWHVHRSWRRKLHKIIPQDRELHSELYQDCIILMEEKNTNTFKSLREMFAKTYRSICKEYVDYFEQYYLN